MPSKALRIAGFYVVVIVAWAPVARAEVWSPFLFPAPESVFRSLARNLESGLVLEALKFSMLRLVVGYGISLVIGLALGFLTATSRWADEPIGGIVLGLQSLPSITWLPMAVLWFGLSERAIIFVVLMGSTFSVAISAGAGMWAMLQILVTSAD